MTESEKKEDRPEPETASAAAATPREPEAEADFESMNLQVGARLQFLLAGAGKGAPLFSTLIGYVPDEYLIVKIPFEKEKNAHLPLKEEDKVLIRVFSGVKVFSFASFVNRVFLAGLQYAHLSFPRRIEVKRLRNSVRIQVNLPALAKPATEGQEQALPVQMVNVSVDGARVLSSHRLGDSGSKVGVSFEITVQPGNYQARIEAKGVIRGIDAGTGQESISYGIEFEDIDATQAIMLQNFIYQAQIADRRKVV